MFLAQASGPEGGAPVLPWAWVANMRGKSKRISSRSAETDVYDVVRGFAHPWVIITAW